MTKIVVLDGYTTNPGDLGWDSLRDLGDLKVYDRTGQSPEKIISNIGDATIILTNKTVLNREVLVKVPHVKYIGVLATGYNVVDTVSARELGITVTNIPAYSTSSVVQMTFALLLELCHHVGAHSEAVYNGEWSKSIDFCFWKYPLVELTGKTMGIIGFGRIGQSVAKVAEAFGMNVLAFDHSVHPELENENCHYSSLDDLLKKSDVISLHCPLNDETKWLINKKSIAMMKDGVMIINTSRGPVINEADLAEALNSGKVSGAGVDVVSVEPVTEDNPLLKARNCIITPHIAWAPREARSRLLEIAVSNIRSFLEAEPVNVVN